MTITPEAIIGASVIEVESDGDCIYHIVLEQPNGVLVELEAKHAYECDPDADCWIEVL